MPLVSRGLSSCNEVLLGLFLSNEVRNYFHCNLEKSLAPVPGGELLWLIFAVYVRILWPYYRPCLSHFGKNSGPILVLPELVVLPENV